MDLGLGSSVVAITGGSGGIGRATAHAFAREGAKVVIADLRDGSRGGRGPVVEELGSEGYEALFVPTDVTDMGQVQKFLDVSLDSFGRLDVLVNNAAWWPTPTGFFWDEEVRHWDRMIDVILRGTLNCSRVVSDHMREHGGGAIVNVSSDSARRGEQRETTYSAAKAAVVGLTMSLAIGLGPSKIRVNCVSPGRTLTEQYHDAVEAVQAQGEAAVAAFKDREKRALKLYPLRKFGTPEEVANVIVGLASPTMSSHVTGQVVSVSGGYFVG